MFKPQRVGTPIIHTYDLQTDTAAWTPNVAAQSAMPTGNVINAIPDGEFGRKELRWAGGAAIAIAANSKIALLHQFTVTMPEAGDTIGLELNAAIQGSFQSSAGITPIFGKISVANTLLGAVTFQPGVTYMGGSQYTNTAANGVIPRGTQYKETMIVRATRETVAGTYAHGFMITDIAAVGWNLAYFHMMASVRQLNDQQGIGYRDTLR